MHHQVSSIPGLVKYRPFTQSTLTGLLNVSSKVVNIDRKSRIQRWIFGMMIGSAPFLAIILCWMFVSVCINNLVRYCQKRKLQHRYEERTIGIKSGVSSMHV